MLLLSTKAQPSIVCPNYFETSGIINDLGLLADSVSWNNVQTVEGVCHTYNKVFESDGIYDTRMRVYSTDDLIVFTFRPTQNSAEGGNIHVDRKLVPTTFFNGTELVDNRMQEAFISLTKDFDYDIIRNKTILMGAHSLGGIFIQFQMIYLQEVLNITTKFSLGFAGPFVGNRAFYNKYQKQFKTNNITTWWQVEDVNRYNPSDFDGTVEGYNTPYPPFIYIANEAICGLYITVQEGTYGMHDLINYRSALKGTDCILNL
jgi:hypothetical protein